MYEINGNGETGNGINHLNDVKRLWLTKPICI